MKKIFFTLTIATLCAISAESFSQNDSAAKQVILPVSIVRMDTMITTKNTIIVGKITKVSDTEIEYKKVYEPDAAIFVINKEKLKEIKWSNGTIDEITMDEMEVNKESEVIDKRSAIKFDFFSPINDQIKFSYEHSIKVGANIEVAASLINNSMLKSSINSQKYLIQGGTLGVGVKFLLGQNYYIKGLKYIHPLSGRFVKPEIAYSGYTVRGVNTYIMIPQNGGYYNYVKVKSDKKINSIAFIINYGRQFILGNLVTIGYSIGVGYSYINTKYSNPDVNPSTLPTYNSYNYEGRNDPTNLYTHFRLKNLPIAYNGSITIGYLFK